MRTLSSAIAKVFSPAPVPQAGPAIGRIQYVVGSVTVIRADGTKLQGIVTDDLYAGDALDTGGDGRVGVTFRDGTAFCLSHESRMVLDEYVCSPDGTLSSAQLCVSRGRFAFIASSTGDNLAVDTPFARIRGSANNGAIGVVTVAALTFALMHDLRAAAPDLEFLLDDLLSYKDMQHGTFELVIKGPAPRIVSVDDPEVTFVVNPSETGANVQQVTNTAADMAALLAASQEAHATYLLGLADPFTTGAASGQRALGSGAYDVVQLAINLNARALPSLRTENQNSVGSDFLDRDSPDALVQTTVSSGTADLTVAGDGGETSVSTGLSFVTGTDAITLSFAASQSPVVSGLDETASLTWQRDRRRSERADASGQDRRRDGDHADADRGCDGGGRWRHGASDGDGGAVGQPPASERAGRRQPDDHGAGGERHRHRRRDHHRDGECDGGGRCAERRDCCSGCGWDAGDGQHCSRAAV